MSENVEITRKEFEAYLAVQKSELTNLFDVIVVQELSDLSRQELLYIMKHYHELKQKYAQTVE